jgi:hypothetical protein
MGRIPNPLPPLPRKRKNDEQEKPKTGGGMTMMERMTDIYRLAQMTGKRIEIDFEFYLDLIPELIESGLNSPIELPKDGEPIMKWGGQPVYLKVSDVQD